MMIYHGTGVFGAIAMGTAYVLQRKDPAICQTHVDDIASEIQRAEAAKRLALQQLNDIQEKALAEMDAAHAQIFEAHKMLLEDEAYNSFLRNLIETDSVNAEYAVSLATEHFAAMFSAMEDPYLQARAADLQDVSHRWIACLGHAEKTHDTLPENSIVCADDLTPSETVGLDKTKVLAFVTASGSISSHTAILARSRSIPAVVQIGEDFLKAIKTGVRLIVDGATGEVILEPDEETLHGMQRKQQEEQQRLVLLQELKDKEAVTMDGRRIQIAANIGGVNDVEAVLANGADGIGLFRSEFLYLERTDFPSEEEQFLAYRSVLEGMKDKRVIIRTLDIGADKQLDYFKLDHEENPALGLRAIRVCLARPELFQTQLRALYRASFYGKLGILFPMITSVAEVEKCLAHCEEVKAQLRKKNIPFDESVEIGIMIETPAAALISDKLALLVNFFSVGTNDLTQYTLAMDRQNAKLSPFSDTHHEAILRLIQMSAENAHQHGAWIGICGELAADCSLTETFLRMGIDELSVATPFLLPLRETVTRLDLSKEKGVAN